MCNNVVWWAHSFQCATILVESTEGSNTPQNLVQCFPNPNPILNPPNPMLKSKSTRNPVATPTNLTSKSTNPMDLQISYTYLGSDWPLGIDKHSRLLNWCCSSYTLAWLLWSSEGHEHGDSWVQGDYFLYTYVLHLQADIYTPTKLVWLFSFPSSPSRPFPSPSTHSHPAAASRRKPRCSWRWDWMISYWYCPLVAAVPHRIVATSSTECLLYV